MDIAFETTFSGQSEINEILTAKANGYQIILYYVALQSSLDKVIRVQESRSNSGHDVENEDIVRRYEKSRQNLLAHTTYLTKLTCLIIQEISDHVLRSLKMER